MEMCGRLVTNQLKRNRASLIAALPKTEDPMSLYTEYLEQMKPARTGTAPETD